MALSKLQSVDDLKGYCLRKLGSPVINIEIDDTQTYDRINDAIEYFVERHFDGTTESFYKLAVKQKDVENKYLSLPSDILVVTEILSESSDASIEPMDSFEYNIMDEMNRSGIASVAVIDYFLTMQHLEMVLDMFTSSKLFTFNNATRKLIPQYNLTNVGSANLLLSPLDISGDDWTSINATLTGDDVEVPNGKLIGDTVTSDAAGTFGFEQSVDTDYYVRGLYTAGITINPGTYTGQVKISLLDGSDVVVKEKIVTPIANRWEYFYVEGAFGTAHTNGTKIIVETITPAAAAGETFHCANISIFRNAMMFVQGYSSIDADDSVDIYNDRWIKKYATALIKQQWGSNVKKYSGIQMPGGVELNGQQIFDEASLVVEKLEEEFSLTYELPVDFYVA